MKNKILNSIILDFVLDRDTLSSTFTTSELKEFLLRNREKYSIEADDIDVYANSALQELSLNAPDKADRLFVNTNSEAGNWEVNITHEKEWVENINEILDRTQLDGISVSEIKKLPFIDEYLKPGDMLVRRTKRKGEQWYGQQLRNIKSHNNKSFQYKQVDGVNYITRLNGAEDQEVTLLLGLDEAVTTVSKEVAKQIGRSEPKMINVKGGYKFATSTPLKNYVKELRGHSCELGCDMSIASFINSNGVWYTEAHHIVPMKYQQSVSVNLDNEDNLIVLCPKHHMEFHHGNKEAFQSIVVLLKKFKDDPKVLINDFEELNGYYKHD